MKNKDLNKLAKEVHENAVKNGFWDDNPSTKHCLMMVVTELSEAVEADRKGKRCNIKWLEETKQEDDFLNFEDYFTGCIKDTVEDELADAYTRLLDLAGKEEVDLNIDGCYQGSVFVENTFTENVYEIIKDLVNSKYSLEEKVRYAKFQVEAFAEILNIDLLHHVELKMKYNQTREYKHGKRY